ncbi:MAG: NTPase [Armatimonadetes bacterium]|nr:NTPase [Armatimonadota bacterium]
MVRKNLLITGKPGIGKTTVIKRILSLLPPNFKADGFFTEEVREGGERIGFQIVTLDGQRGWLARKGLMSRHQVGKYGVDEKAIERLILPTLKKAIDGSDLIVIDEIAKMELCHPEFEKTVWQCLESQKPVLGVIQQSRLPFLDKVRLRDDVWLWEVTTENRKELPKKIAEVLEQFLKNRRLAKGQ